MELVAKYLKLNKRLDPWLKEYFSKDCKLSPHEYVIKNKTEEAKRSPYFRIARGSGKSGLHMAIMENMSESNSPLDDFIQQAAREHARQIEQRLFDSLQLDNGSRIEALGDASGNIRGRRANNLLQHIHDYGSTGVRRLLSHGNVPSVSDDSR